MALHSRIKRINEELRTVIADVIQNEIKDPRLTDVLVTVTAVFTSKDLHQAQVYVSILGDDAKTKDAMEALSHSHGYIRSQVASNISLRFTPELVFKFDDTGRNAAHIQSLLKKIEKDNPDAFVAPPPEETVNEVDGPVPPDSDEA